MQVYTVFQMREAERRTETEYGIPLAALMDNAGKGLARAALEMLASTNSLPSSKRRRIRTARISPSPMTSARSSAVAA